MTSLSLALSNNSQVGSPIQAQSSPKNFAQENETFSYTPKINYFEDLFSLPSTTSYEKNFENETLFQVPEENYFDDPSLLSPIFSVPDNKTHPGPFGYKEDIHDPQINYIYYDDIDISNETTNFSFNESSSFSMNDSSTLNIENMTLVATDSTTGKFFL